MQLSSLKRQVGVTLMEILVATAVAVLLLSAAAAVGLTSLSGSKDGITNANAGNELQTIMNSASRELRRAGYNKSQEDLAGADNQRFRKIWFFNETTTGSGLFQCVIFRYDRTPDGAGLTPPGNSTVDALDVRGLRLNGQTLEILTTASTSPPAACPNTGWTALSSSNKLKLTANTGFTVSPLEAMLLDGSMIVDSIRINLSAHASNNNSIALSESIQLRNRPIRQ